MYQVKAKGHRVQESQLMLVFPLTDEPGSAFSFECDQYGAVQFTKEAGLPAFENYRNCLLGTHPVDKPHIETRHHSYWEPTLIECYCGMELRCGSFTNTCNRCHKDYSSSGQLLATRSQWGEETGETASDILNYDYNN